MPFNGSGIFTRVHNWVDDENAAIDITASRCDAEDDGFATGLSTCITKDGQTTITANLPMATYRHTGVGNAVDRTDYSAAGQVQDGAMVYAADSGTADTYAITLAPAITAYAAGQVFVFKAGNSNTGASTLNVNAVGAKNILDHRGSALTADTIVQDGVYVVVYDGTQFQLVTLSGRPVANGRILSATTYNGYGISATSNTAAGRQSVTFSEAASTAAAQVIQVCQGQNSPIILSIDVNTTTQSDIRGLTDAGVATTIYPIMVTRWLI